MVWYFIRRTCQDKEAYNTASDAEGDFCYLLSLELALLQSPSTRLLLLIEARKSFDGAFANGKRLNEHGDRLRQLYLEVCSLEQICI